MPYMQQHRPANVEMDGPALRRLRKTRGKSVTSLARDAMISNQYLSFIERNLRNPSPEVFVRICNALGLESDGERGTLMREADRSAA